MKIIFNSSINVSSLLPCMTITISLLYLLRVQVTLLCKKMYVGKYVFFSFIILQKYTSIVLERQGGVLFLYFILYIWYEYGTFY